VPTVVPAAARPLRALVSKDDSDAEDATERHSNSLCPYEASKESLDNFSQFCTTVLLVATKNVLLSAAAVNLLRAILSYVLIDVAAPLLIFVALRIGR
jgi:hypothetical protein